MEGGKGVGEGVGAGEGEEEGADGAAAEDAAAAVVRSTKGLPPKRSMATHEVRAYCQVWPLPLGWGQG
jgi:hypothetical protein